MRRTYGLKNKKCIKLCSYSKFLVVICQVISWGQYNFDNIATL